MSLSGLFIWWKKKNKPLKVVLEFFFFYQQVLLNPISFLILTCDSAPLKGKYVTLQTWVVTEEDNFMSFFLEI